MQLTERIPRESGRDYALRMLKDNIIRLELEPGSRISENDLALQLNLSRTPVREALMELARVKIVEIYPQRGSAVALVDYKVVEEARFMRYVLEVAVVELVCQKAQPKDILELEENIRLQDFYLESKKTDELFRLDDEFHEKLFQIAEKTQIHEIMNGLTIHFDRVRAMALTSVKDIKTVEDHKAILGAIKEGKCEEARMFMDKHLNRYKIDEEFIRRKYPQYFKTEG